MGRTIHKRNRQGILRDVENGSLEITEEYEDIHSFVEAVLTDRIGDVGKKLHTGRSRFGHKCHLSENSLF